MLSRGQLPSVPKHYRKYFVLIPITIFDFWNKVEQISSVCLNFSEEGMFITEKNFAVEAFFKFFV